MVPVLKYVRGEHLSQDHWLDMFRLLGLPRGTTLERLTFNDLLAVANTIIEKAMELKVCTDEFADCLVYIYFLRVLALCIPTGSEQSCSGGGNDQRSTEGAGFVGSCSHLHPHRVHRQQWAHSHPHQGLEGYSQPGRIEIRLSTGCLLFRR